MKRLKYISRLVGRMTEDDMLQLANVSKRNNEAADVTGALIKLGHFFFQVLEGPEAAVDETFARIATDPRHESIVIVGEPEHADHRLFDGWAMRVENLDPRAEQRLADVNAVLETALLLRNQSDELALVAQRSLLRELSQRPRT